MDILKPQLTWIDGRCYRVNAVQDQYRSDSGVAPADEQAAEAQLDAYVEQDLYDGDDADAALYDIQYSESAKRFRHSVHVPKAFRGALIGAKGNTRKRLEADTRTAVKIPAAGAEGDVEISGPTRDSIVSARRRIDLLVNAARAKNEPTHFVCVPVVQTAIRQRFVQFRQRILEWPQRVFGLDESMFADGDKLHITIAVTALVDQADRELAVRLLDECQASVVRPALRANGGSPLAVRVRGVDCMTDDPAETHVLYGRVVDDHDGDGSAGALQSICDAIHAAFARHGLVGRAGGGQTSAKMHVTLINSRFRQNAGDPYGDDASAEAPTGEAPANRSAGNRTQRHPFDARQIVREFGAYDFGRLTVDEIHLSRRFTTSCTTGFYDASTVLKVF